MGDLDNTQDAGWSRLPAEACASIADIAAMKAYAIGRRATARDYVDLHHLLVVNGQCSIDSIITDALAKFVDDSGEALFSPRLFLQQLAYTEDVDDVATLSEIDIDPETFPRIAVDLKELVREYTENSITER